MATYTNRSMSLCCVHDATTTMATDHLTACNVRWCVPIDVHVYVCLYFSIHTPCWCKMYMYIISVVYWLHYSRLVSVYTPHSHCDLLDSLHFFVVFTLSSICCAAVRRRTARLFASALHHAITNHKNLRAASSHTQDDGAENKFIGIHTLQVPVYSKYMYT